MATWNLAAAGGLLTGQAEQTVLCQTSGAPRVALAAALHVVPPSRRKLKLCGLLHRTGGLRSGHSAPRYARVYMSTTLSLPAGAGKFWAQGAAVNASGDHLARTAAPPCCAA